MPGVGVGARPGVGAGVGVGSPTTLTKDGTGAPGAVCFGKTGSVPWEGLVNVKVTGGTLPAELLAFN
jgi:hypothetical protein